MELEAKIECPECGRQVTVKVKEMVPGRTKNCPNCKVLFQFTGDDGRKAQIAVDDLLRKIKKIGL